MPFPPPAPDLPLLANADTGARERSGVTSRESTLDAARWTRLRQLAADAGVTPHAALAAALAEVLRAWSSTETFTLGCRTPSGRAPLVMRGGRTFVDRAREVDDQLNGAVPAPGGAVLRVRWRCADARYPHGMLDDMFDAYGRLLDALSEEPRYWYRQRFDLIPDWQARQWAAVNATAWPVPSALPHELVAANARRHPDRVAVIAPDRRLTYGELYRRANQIGRALRAAGASPDRLVGIVMEKGWEQYAAVFGVLSAGAAYLPIDPAVPAERLRHLLDNANVELVLTQSTVDGRLRWPATVRRFHVDGAFDRIDGAELSTAQRPTDLAYVIYTSGSTGSPKGVMVDNRGVLNTILDLNRRFGIGAEDRSLAVSGLHFDASVFDVFGPLIAGGAVVIPPHDERPDPACWLRLIERERVTCWLSVPALMEMLTGHAARAGAGHELHSLRVAMLGGDWIPLDLPGRLRALAPGVSVISSGGPTETVCLSILYPIGDIDPQWTSIPYGKPMANQHYYVLDEHLRQRPVWVPGQICIGSAVGLARGYWRDPDRTEARFRRLPETGERVYLSGDIGRYLPDGNIEILGRADFQVKIQGYRIELGEIESTLEQHPAVERAVVVAPRSPTGTRYLVAFVVPANGVDVVDTADAFRDFLAERLPSAMVPARWRVLDALPLNGNGKVDRLALVSLAGERADGAPAETAPAGSGAPRTALETAVADLFAEALGLASVGPDTHFFVQGGDSLAASRLCGRLHERLGVDLPLRDFFAGPTVAQICARLPTATPSRSTVDEWAADATMPLPGQRGMWTAERLIGAGLYTLIFAVFIDGPLDTGRLDGAIAATVRRHEGLRTGFRMAARDLERVLAPADWCPPREDIVAPVGEPFDEFVRTAAVRHAAKPFGAEGSPPLRTLLVRADDERHALVLITHHMLVDGWAIGLMLREMFDRYETPAADPRPAPRPGIVAVRQRQLEASGALRRQADFWKHQLDGVPTVLELPSARPRPPRQDPAGARIALEYGAERTEVVRQRARELGVTTFAVLLSAFGRVLSQYTRSQTLLVGVPTSRRSTGALRDLIAHCTIVVPVRLDIPEGADSAGLIRGAHASIADSLSNADLPFEHMVRIGGGNGDMRRNPLVQAVFGRYDQLIERHMSAGPLRLRIEEVHAGGSPMDLTVALRAADPVAGTLEYATGVWDRTEAERFRDDLLTATDTLAHNRVTTARP